MTLAIRPVNDRPVAVSDVVIVAGPGEASIDVLDNDSDVDGRTDLDPASVTIVAGPSLGTATVNATTGAIEYTVSLGTDGTDRLTYLGLRPQRRVLDRRTPEIRIDLPTSPSGTLPPTGSGFGGVAGAAVLVAVGVGALLFVHPGGRASSAAAPSDGQPGRVAGGTVGSMAATSDETSTPSARSCRDGSGERSAIVSPAWTIC